LYAGWSSPRVDYKERRKAEIKKGKCPISKFIRICLRENFLSGKTQKSLFYVFKHKKGFFLSVKAPLEIDRIVVNIDFGHLTFFFSYYFFSLCNLYFRAKLVDG
jgi:hypothetical protein